jgi:predicted MPP superfamily phosphohydrolase
VVTVPLTIAAVLAAAAGLLVAHRLQGLRRLTPELLIRSLIVSLVLTLVIAVAYPRLDGFGRAHLLYLWGVLGLPFIGAAALLLGRASSTRAGRVAAVVLLLPGALGFYATHVEPRWLRTDHATVRVAAARTGSGDVRVAVLADLQTNHVEAYEHRVISRLLALHADVILVAGDLFHGTPTELRRWLERMRTELGRLHAPSGVFFVRGDADPSDYADLLLAGTGITILDDADASITVGDRRIRIGGNRLNFTLGGAVVMRRALQTELADGAIVLLLSHRPDVVSELPRDSRVDLVVAGHTHGGQIVVPFVGPLVTLSSLPRSVARGGLHTIAGNRIFVSPGAGMERGRAPQVRFLDRPSVALLTLADG